ncbi:serine hydrolase domain-containing protein [Maribacter litoralis]|uniref:Beta-lactamase-related domain-containing protein n=1 Tax=marine sediment metagenome TaxID=412755 RepID=A0A0F9U4V9_9ZZZZ|nr:class A beta-lactamase-related serine hydrolase [archaeon]|tara:strand:+ start:963 stop:2051 length:1089 start_codon:yes stop_codon:yes gene_type:complete
MKLRLKFSILILLTGICTFGQSNNRNDSKINSFLDSLKNDSFSGVILVAHNDVITERRAYGMASIEYGVPNKIVTKFNLASITKMFTAVSTLQLYEKGLLELNSPIGKYLPDYPNQLVRDSVTIHQLLTHTSGNNNSMNYWEKNNLDYKNVSDFAQLFINDSLLSKPGTKYDYSGSGFVILGLIIEKVSGQDYYDYVREHIFIPSEMSHTTELEIDSIVPNKASGYTTLFGENNYLKKNDYYLSKASPAGFHYSTIDDLFRFSKSLRNYILLKEETTELMFEPKVKGYNTNLGYGIDIDLRYNQTIQGHSGGWYGVHNELMDFMKDNYTVIILSNVDDGGYTGTSMVADFFKALIADKEFEN